MASSRGHQRTPAQIQSPKLKEAAMPLVSEEIGEPSLLLFPPACLPDGARSWGCCDGPTMNAKITDCYNKVIHWRRIVFRVPSGGAGKASSVNWPDYFRALPKRPELSPTPLLLLQSYHTCCSKRCHKALFQPNEKGEGEGGHAHPLRRLKGWNSALDLATNADEGTETV